MLLVIYSRRRRRDKRGGRGRDQEEKENSVLELNKGLKIKPIIVSR